jgi:hypothetical protein
LRQRVALVATLARLYVGVVLIDRERECRGHRRWIVGVVYDHMCQQQCDQRIGYAGADHLTVTSNDGGSSGPGGPLSDTDIVDINVGSSSAPPHLAYSDFHLG